MYLLRQSNVCHSTCVEDRGQLWKSVSSFHRVGSGLYLGVKAWGTKCLTTDSSCVHFVEFCLVDGGHTM